MTEKTLYSNGNYRLKIEHVDPCPDYDDWRIAAMLPIFLMGLISVTAYYLIIVNDIIKLLMVSMLYMAVSFIIMFVVDSFINSKKPSDGVRLFVTHYYGDCSSVNVGGYRYCKFTDDDKLDKQNIDKHIALSKLFIDDLVKSEEYKKREEVNEKEKIKQKEYDAKDRFESKMSLIDMGDNNV